MKNTFSALLFFCLILNGISLVSADLSGRDDPDFKRAIEWWLADDDQQSLPVLSSLAKVGNKAARLLLSRIEFTDRSPQQAVMKLKRSQSHALFRHQVSHSPFPRSWITTEANSGNILAQSLRRAVEPGIDIDGVRHLYSIGEKEAAEHKIRKIAVDGSRAEQQEVADFLGDNDSLTPYIRGFQFSREGMTTGKTAMQAMLGDLQKKDATNIVLGNDADTKSAIAFVDIGYQAGRQAVDYDDSGSYFDSIARWISQDKTANPVLRICQKHCTVEEQSSCLVTAFGLIGGYYELHRFDSPLEALISQSDFLSSARSEGMMLRRIASARSEATVPVFDIEALAKRSACLAEAVSTVKY